MLVLETTSSFEKGVVYTKSVMTTRILLKNWRNICQDVGLMIKYENSKFIQNPTPLLFSSSMELEKRIIHKSLEVCVVTNF